MIPMYAKCGVCGMTCLLVAELSGAPCIPPTRPYGYPARQPYTESVPQHECHAVKPHTEIIMDIETPPKPLSTGVGSASVRITPPTGSLGLAGYAPMVEVG